ncbi:MAG TPA: nicotinate-nucleotide--dimethylbenzimidazole phosphoribosyltransferase [Hungateiclostridium thermocellum]|uniref:Nicotinate-nucleotide--dimethylbenzimidazole phosphoribosyltransferase n=2 Tax=Acetivibrio thermocellus TaxID=1515 RepID=COBT_ACET2|nr:nicotinate-nucleotide--dimethylbenzimidazole phosphoribosyltransferase [Acetivibrio thermocellus]A3DF00.1 RecName: Full=Nicotinate-nucleotide--dimethylbenzimidazole phosphoribosyltransferase; Short=NN:DBI PRT; AltName: Full=N(1)-alpha-phosphoribosyltransferase [Acetivibrio thermocellus ATCC 27405]CDG35968.1 Nicotinate-nucleotide-dimethylbenzimidazolephosphoribosyltransferase [Acetivibrio thermocellus BC1]ABN52529.1 nicotinate-nucleotide/dimethylbenzimidazole phosphoribosyltransferase [Acetivi
MLFQTLKSIGELYKEPMDMVQRRLDSLSKPLGSLGRLEDIIKKLAGITGEVFPCVDKKAVIIMCADNGVVEEGISSCPKDVTSKVTRNFLKGITAINAFAKHTGSDIVVVDIGVDDDMDCEGIVKRKVRKGTWNIAKGPAMTRKEAIEAIEVGISIVEELGRKGVNLLGTGEMGIGNTTTSSAVSTVLTDSKAENMVGRGAGLSDEALKRKISIVKKAIDLNRPDANDPIDVVSKVGGFDIAGLAGCFIGAAACRIPILIDGFISATAALAAVRMEPKVKNFIFPSHGSAEPGSKKVMEALGFEPILNLEMRVGEGTGAALAFHIFDCAVSVYRNMGTFEDACIEQYQPQV